MVLILMLYVLEMRSASLLDVSGTGSSGAAPMLCSDDLVGTSCAQCCGLVRKVLSSRQSSAVSSASGYIRVQHEAELAVTLAALSLSAASL